MPDLITSDYAAEQLELSAADLARLPRAIASASALVRNHCGRYFTRRPSADGTLGPIDELITAPHQGDILLSEYPVNDVLRVSTSKDTILSVGNRDGRTNQRALCRLVRGGDPIAGFETIGLYLERWASGLKIAETVTFSDLAEPTIAALARAVNALGGGWEASPAGDGDRGEDYSLWPVSELRAGQGASGALQDDAEFEAWTDDIQCERNDEAGILALVNLENNPFTSVKWGPSSGLTFGDDQIIGDYHGVRVVYDAGYDPIPEDLQQAVLEVAKAILERQAASATVKSERTVTWSVELRDVFHALPPQTMEVLAYYRSHAR